MEYKIRYYVEELFKNAPQTEKTMDTREEIVANLLEKYRELIAGGMEENEAYKTAIENIGNIGEIFENLGYAPPANQKPTKAKDALSPSKAAVLHSINSLIWLVCVALYFLISFKTMAWHITWVIFVITPAVTSVVTALFRWKSGARIKGLVHSSMWCIITGFYFIISFATMAWYITWGTFLIGAALSQIINIAFNLRGEEENHHENG